MSYDLSPSPKQELHLKYPYVQVSVRSLNFCGHYGESRDFIGELVVIIL